MNARVKWWFSFLSGLAICALCGLFAWHCWVTWNEVLGSAVLLTIAVAGVFLRWLIDGGFGDKQ